jgi:hypothetical protein
MQRKLIQAQSESPPGQRMGRRVWSAPRQLGDFIIYDAKRPILSKNAGYDNARELADRECWRDGELFLYRWG